jgi:general stress protein YciG
MTGNRASGLKAAVTNTANDPDFYRRIGSIGGKKRHDGPRGFAKMPLEKRQAAGAKGGKASRRKPQWYYDRLREAEEQARKDEELQRGLDALQQTSSQPTKSIVS